MQSFRRLLLVVGFGVSLSGVGCGDSDEPNVAGNAAGKGGTASGGSASTNAGAAGHTSHAGTGGGSSAGSAGFMASGGLGGGSGQGEGGTLNGGAGSSAGESSASGASGEGGSAGDGTSGTSGGDAGAAGASAGTAGASGNAGASAGASGSAGSGGTKGSAGASGSAGESAGSSGAGGSGGTKGSAGASGSAGAPNCDDGIAETADSYSVKYGCGHKYDSNPKDTEAWMLYDSGISIDLKSKLAWTNIAGSRNRDDVTTACAALVRAGIDTWRIPNINDARTLAPGCNGMDINACQLNDPKCLTQACGNCGSCIGGGGPWAGSYCKPDARVCSHFHTSSLCSDCSTTSDWTFVPSNGHFLAYTPGSSVSTFCVADNAAE